MSLVGEAQLSRILWRKSKAILGGSYDVSGGAGENTWKERGGPRTFERVAIGLALVLELTGLALPSPLRFLLCLRVRTTCLHSQWLGE